MPRSKDETKVIAIFDATLSVVMKTGFNGLISHKKDERKRRCVITPFIRIFARRN